MSNRARQLLVFATLATSVLMLVRTAAQEQGQVREFNVVGDRYAFAPGTISVNRNDLVKVTFTARDMPHSFTVDGPYRISKRAGAGQFPFDHILGHVTSPTGRVGIAQSAKGVSLPKDDPRCAPRR